VLKQNNCTSVRLEIITAVTMPIIRLMDVTPCSRVEICGRFSFFIVEKLQILSPGVSSPLLVVFDVHTHHIYYFRYDF
jgi:hypothetical protein